MVGAFPLPRRDSVRSFPVGAKLSMGRVSGSAHYLSQNEISNLKVFVFDSGVIVFGHTVLVPCEPLFSCCPHLVH